MAIREKRKQANYEVVVVGGGLSGMCAALAAARHGAKTALIQARHVLGGNSSSEIRMHICGASENMKKPELEEGGILYELMLENKSRNDYFNYSIWDMVLFEKVKKQENLTVYFNTAMERCTLSGNRITEVRCYQQTTETFWDIAGDIFVDATGNGSLGYYAGASYRQGSESREEFGEPDAPEKADNHRMGNTLLFKAVDRGTSVNFKRPSFAQTFTEEQLRFRNHAAKKYSTFDDSGSDDDYARMANYSTSSVDYGYWWIEVPGKKEDIVDEYEEIRDELVACIYGIWDHVKNGGDHGAENFDLEWVGMMPGMRESRRLEGDYILVEQDILSNRIFPDAVAYGGWAMDNHVSLFDFDELPSTVKCFEGAYTIPYRCFYSKDLENMYMAGRIISTSKQAFSSTRVMGTCAIGGQAVGTAAAMCIRYGCGPRGIASHMEELQQQLLKDDCYLPGYHNTDAGDLALKAAVSASSEKRESPCTNVVNGVSREEKGMANLWESDGISPEGETLTLTLKTTEKVSQVRLTFDPNFRYPIKLTLSDRRRAQQRIGVPPELVKDYDVILLKDGTPIAQKSVRGNYQRLNAVDFETCLCDQVRICFLNTNGCKDIMVQEVRIYS